MKNRKRTYEEMYGKEKVDIIITKKINKKKGKSYIELYGEEKAEKIKTKIKQKRKGKSYIEQYGEEKANKLRNLRKGKTYKEIYGTKRYEKILSKMNKGKTYEEIYGEEKSNKIKIKLGMGQTFEQRFGKEKSDKIKLRMSNIRKGRYKGVNYNERHGEKRAKEIKLKMSKSRTGKGVKYKSKDLITLIQDIFKENGPLTKIELEKRKEEFNFCSCETLRQKFGSRNNFAEYAGIEFKICYKGIGTTEKIILDHIEKERGIILERQYNICRKKIDGYDLKNNIAFEVDEPHHKNQLEEDLKREIVIKEKIGCKFVRINEREYLNRIRNKILGDF